jgi:hypothetical protein
VQFDRARGRRVQLVVQIRIQQRAHVVVSHDPSPTISAS